jgi:hypothetical protein
MMMAPCLPVSGHFSDAAVVDSMPADHFIPANYHLLTQLCRHVVEARRIAQLTKAYRKKKTDFNVRVYGELLKAQLSESSIIQRLSCSMRLTQQSKMLRWSSKKNPQPRIVFPEPGYKLRFRETQRPRSEWPSTQFINSRSPNSDNPSE